MAAKKVIEPKTFDLLRKVAERADLLKDSPEKTEASRFLMARIFTSGFTANEVVTALSQYNDSGDHEQVIGELADALETAAGTLTVKETELVEKTRQIVTLETELMRYKTMGGTEAEMRSKMFEYARTIDRLQQDLQSRPQQSQSQPQQAGNASASFQQAAQQVQVDALQEKLRLAEEINKSLTESNRELGASLSREAIMRMEMAQRLDDVNSNTARMVDQAMADLKSQIMGAVIPAPTPIVNNDVLAQIQTYMSNSQASVNKIVKFRESAKAFFNICARALGETLVTEHASTNTFMKQPTANPNSYAEITRFIFEKHGMKKNYNLLINDNEYWLYAEINPSNATGLLTATRYLNVNGVTLDTRWDGSKLNSPDHPSVYLKPAMSHSGLNLEPLTSFMLARMFTQTQDIQAMAKILRPLGYTI